jgi:predicted small secreted protein
MLARVAMKISSVIILLGCATFLAGCETTDSAGGGNQEAKRRAAIEQQKDQPPVDQAHANLWNAQENRLDRDSNPLRAY